MMMLKTLSVDSISDALTIMQRVHPWPWTRAIFEMFLKKDFRLLGAYQPDLSGFYVAQQIVDESHLLMICVDPKSQRRGIARQLMQNYLTHYTQQGCKHFFLEVRQSNFPAQNLYQDFGFQVYSRRKEYYQHQDYKEDAILMRYDLIKR